MGLITALAGRGGYHYNDPGETGYFPLWIVPVYFLGGPAVGNLARGVWQQLLPGGGGGAIDSADAADAGTDAPSDAEGPRCDVCNDTRAVGCPNCDAQGYYITYGRRVSASGDEIEIVVLAVVFVLYVLGWHILIAPFPASCVLLADSRSRAQPAEGEGS